MDWATEYATLEPHHQPPQPTHKPPTWDYTPKNPDPDLTIHAEGRPAAQGSKRHIGNGRMIEQSKRVKPWRKTVADAARKAMAEAGQTEPLDGPLRVEITFTVLKPASAPKRRRTWPTTRHSGDIDKLQRAALDGIADAGAHAIADDSRIIDIHATKTYPGEHPNALPEPGAIIRIWTLETQ